MYSIGQKFDIVRITNFGVLVPCTLKVINIGYAYVLKVVLLKLANLIVKNNSLS